MFVLPFAAAVVTGAVLLALGYGTSLPGLLAYSFSAFVAVSIVLEFVRGRLATGSVFRLVARNRRRYGGYLVHVAVLLFAIGVAGSSAYQTVRETTLLPGQSLSLAGYTLTYRTTEGVQGANYTGFRAIVDVSRGRSRVATVRPGENFYPIEGPANEASIYHDPRTLGDVFTTAQVVNKKTQEIDLKVLTKPLVNLIWAAGFLFVFGSLVALWPDAVEQRRLAARYATATA
jgi:cytochrome c-type biogenesis protein CcmF